MNVVKSKEFWVGAVVAVLLLKFGDRIPVVGQYVSRLK